MATHSSILAWKIPWMEESGGLQSVGLQRVGHDEWLHFHFHKWCRCCWPGDQTLRIIQRLRFPGICVCLPEACPDDPPVWMTHLGCLDGFSPSKVPIPFPHRFLRNTAPILILLPKMMMVVVWWWWQGRHEGWRWVSISSSLKWR